MATTYYNPPNKFISGTTVTWTVTSTDYKPSDGWSLVYTFVKTGEEKIQITSTDSSDNHLLTIPSTTTFAGGNWKYQAIFVNGDTKYLYTQGEAIVEQSFADAGAGYDARSHAEKTLDAIEAVLEKRATKDQSSYSVGNVSLSRMTVDELLALKKHYKSIVLKERHGFGNIEQMRMYL